MRTRKIMADIVGHEGNVLSHHMRPEMLEKKFADAKFKDMDGVREFLKKVTYDKQGWVEWQLILQIDRLHSFL